MTKDQKDGDKKVDGLDMMAKELGMTREEVETTIKRDQEIFGSGDPVKAVDFLLRGDEGPTDIFRIWVAASIPCKYCATEGNAKPEGAGRFAVSFLNIRHGIGIRFFCDEHAQQIQDELIKRGIEITTLEQKLELDRKIKPIMAMLDDVSELSENKSSEDILE